MEKFLQKIYIFLTWRIHVDLPFAVWKTCFCRSSTYPSNAPAMKDGKSQILLMSRP